MRGLTAYFSERRMDLMALPMGEPPGSRVSNTATPRVRSASASMRAWEVFPHPSTPSKVRNTIASPQSVSEHSSLGHPPQEVGAMRARSPDG